MIWECIFEYYGPTNAASPPSRYHASIMSGYSIRECERGGLFLSLVI